MTEFSAELVTADGSRIALSGEQKVGRSAGCDITIDDARVSRGHAMLRVIGDRLTVEDLGSANGTRVNEMATIGEVALADGDIVCFEKHCYGVALAGGYQDLDATVVDSDATVVAIPTDPEPEPLPEVVPEPEVESKPVVAAVPPEPVAEPEPAPTPEKITAAPAQAPVADLPGSWVDGPEGGDHTRVLSMADVPEPGAAINQMDRASDVPHLIVVNENGTQGDVLELQPTVGGEPDVWEIGRDESCEIVLSEPSVSARHAQLIHDEGRWRMVNLISANGIFVNGEKRLTAYLSDGDEIRMGKLNLVFRAAAGAATSTSSAAVSGKTASSRKPYLLVAGVVVVVLAGLWFAFLH